MDVDAHRVVRTVVLIVFAVLLIAMGACGRRGDTDELPGLTDIPATLTPLPTDTPLPTLTPRPTNTPTVTPTPTRDPHANPLTGLSVEDPAVLNRRPLAVRVGNDPVVRPQDGLGFADVVIEEVMDGWSVTRFTAIFYGEEAERIRPVRSARLSSLSIVPQYDAASVHSGASDHIRWLISQADFVDLDEFFHPTPYRYLSGYDWRGRLYTTTSLVHQYLEAKGWERSQPIDGYLFDRTPPEGEPATSVHIPYPSSSIVDWIYDADSGLYLREVAGRPHTEGLTGEQLAAANVIVLYAEHRRTDIVEDVNGATAIDIVVSGEGRAQVFRDGVVQDVRWRQDAPGELIRYYDARGDEVPLKPGKTWIQLVPTDYEVIVG